MLLISITFSIKNLISLTIFAGHAPAGVFDVNSIVEKVDLSTDILICFASGLGAM